MCDRIGIINKGKLIAIDTTQALKKRFGEKLREYRKGKDEGDSKKMSLNKASAFQMAGKSVRKKRLIEVWWNNQVGDSEK